MARNETYTLPVGDEEKARLGALNSICNPFTLSFVRDNVDSMVGKQVLDVGCGTGDMTCQWADLVGHSGRVLGVDISKEQLKLASSLVKKKGLHNVDFEELEVDRLGEVNSSFDMVYCRFVLEHLTDPYAAIDKMLQKVKGDGVFFCEVCTSYEAMFSDPEDERFLRWKDLILQQPKIFNTNFYLGKKIISYLKRHGMSIQATRLCQPIISSVRDRMDLISVIRNQTVKTNYLDSGYCSESEYDAIADGILAYAQQDCLQAFVQYMQLICKPLN